MTITAHKDKIIKIKLAGEDDSVNNGEWWNRAFFYNDRIVLVDADGVVRVAEGFKGGISGWSRELAEKWVPAHIISAAVAWGKSANSLPLVDFLQIMFE